MIISLTSTRTISRSICYGFKASLSNINPSMYTIRHNTYSRTAIFFNKRRFHQSGSHRHFITSLRNIEINQISKSTALYSSTSIDNKSDGGSGFYANEETHPDFDSMGIQSKLLLERIESKLNLARPSAVQVAAFEPILSGKDAVIGAETGSGKTLAYLIPLIDDILIKKERAKTEAGPSDDNCDAFVREYDYCRAVILVPNKELANQVLRMAIDLSGNRKEECVIWDGSNSSPMQFESDEDIVGTNPTVVRLAILPGGLEEPVDFKPFRDSIGLGGSNAPVDILICTPAALGPFGLSPKNIDLFADIQTLIIDEADMLLDGGYLRQLENVLMGFRRADKLSRSQMQGDDDEFFSARKTQHVFVGATLPNFGLKSVDAYISKKFPYLERVAMPGFHNARHYGLKDRTLWLEQNYEDNNRERMEQLVNILNDPDSGLLEEKMMIFLNKVNDVDGATNGLR